VSPGEPPVPPTAADLGYPDLGPAPTTHGTARNAPPRVTGTAGRGAQAEYERRKLLHRQHVHTAHPVLGGLILALSGEPQNVRAWQQGAAGERAVGRRLDKLTRHGVEVLHDRRIPGSNANIDHLAVSPSGVYVIDAKNYTGTVRVERRGGLLTPRTSVLRVGRRDATKLVTGVQRQAEQVRAVLVGISGLPELVTVTGVLAFFEADWPLFAPDEIDGVRLGSPKSAARLIRRAGPYVPADVATIADHLRVHFPAA